MAELPHDPVEVHDKEASADLAKVRDLKESIAHGAVGHAALLYETRCTQLSAVTPPREGHVIRFIRIVKRDCTNCGGLGIKYVLDVARVVISCGECPCVKYEAHYDKVHDPSVENIDGQGGETLRGLPNGGGLLFL